MSHENPYLIPFYIPQFGCTSDCIYCNASITSFSDSAELICEDTFNKKISAYIETRKGRGSRVELCFYGGSFNGLSRDKQDFYFNLSLPYLESGAIDNLRVSLVPQKLNEEVIERLKKFKVKHVELGIQSLNDDILAILKRGHSSKDAKAAVKKLKEAGIEVCAHVMIGLPSEDEQRFFESFSELIGLKPHYLRMHPTVVLKGTELAKMYEKGEYKPLDMEDAVKICSRAYLMAIHNRIKVIRMGLQANALLDLNSVIAGPYHPSFGEMVLSYNMYAQACSIIKNQKDIKGKIQIKVAPRAVSRLLGNNRNNIERIKKTFGFSEIEVIQDSSFDLDKIEVKTV